VTPRAVVAGAKVVQPPLDAVDHGEHFQVAREKHRDKHDMNPEIESRLVILRIFCELSAKQL